MDLKKWKFNFKEVNTILEIVEKDKTFEISIIGEGSTEKRAEFSNSYLLIDLLEDAHEKTHLCDSYYLLNVGYDFDVDPFDYSINKKYGIPSYRTLVNNMSTDGLRRILKDTPLEGSIKRRKRNFGKVKELYDALPEDEKKKLKEKYFACNDLELWYFWDGPDYISDKEEEAVKEVEERLLGMLNNREYKSTEIYKALLKNQESVLYEIDGIKKFSSIVYRIVEAPECKTDEQLRKREAAVNGLAAYICETAAKKGVPAKSDLCIFYSLLTYPSGFALTYPDIAAEMVKGAENKITLLNLAKDTFGKYRVIGSNT